MKKIAIVLLLTMVFGSMVYAGGGKQDSSTAGTTIEYWNGFDPTGSNPLDGQHHIEKYAEYENTHSGVKIVHNMMNYDQTREKAIVSGQAKTGPDFIHMLGEWVPEFVQMGLITDITSDVKAWADYNAFPASTWKVASVNDKIYGIPSIASTRVLVYREDLLKAAGVAVPKTWTELRDAAKKLTTGNVYGFAFCSSTRAVRGPQEFGVFLYSVNKAELAVQQSGKWVPGFTVDQAEQVFQFYYDLMFVDKSVPPYSIGWEWDELDPAFATGTVAMVQDGAWMKGRMAEGVNSSSWKTAPFPYQSNPSTYLEVKVEGIGAFSKNKQATLDFAKWLYGKDNSVYISQEDNLPARSDASQSQYWTNDPVWKGTFLETVKDGFTFPAIPMAPVFEASMQNVQEVLYQRMTPRQSAQDFYNKVKNYLDTEVNN
ncbi:MAG: sugar ABC transporter substrate-binding protein [Treponema sp.]|jgi:ABC-type glycerol-3-phosphate transport system substrate-binding protein|nr:sugar ABC transporter substrate-binding protein [Treponema sp.]